MDASTLVRCTNSNITIGYSQQLLAGCIQALLLAGCTTVNRVAMFLAQLAEESVCFHATQEFASGEAYDRYLNPGGPWQSLGNTEPGDGVRFKGRGFIMLTGRAHYLTFGWWAYRQRLGCPSPTYFIENPTMLASPAWRWLTAVYYWTASRPQMNALADAGDILGATKAVNGGTNGLSTRTFYWNHIRGLGAAILPTEVAVPLTDADLEKVREIARDTVHSENYDLLRAVSHGGHYGNYAPGPGGLIKAPGNGVLDRIYHLEQARAADEQRLASMANMLQQMRSQQHGPKPAGG